MYTEGVHIIKLLICFSPANLFCVNLVISSDRRRRVEDNFSSRVMLQTEDWNFPLLKPHSEVGVKSESVYISEWGHYKFYKSPKEGGVAHQPFVGLAQQSFIEPKMGLAERVKLDQLEKKMC